MRSGTASRVLRVWTWLILKTFCDWPSVNVRYPVTDYLYFPIIVCAKDVLLPFKTTINFCYFYQKSVILSL